MRRWKWMHSLSEKITLNWCYSIIICSRTNPLEITFKMWHKIPSLEKTFNSFINPQPHVYYKIFICSNSRASKQSIIFNQAIHKSLIHNLPFLTWLVDLSRDKTRSVPKKIMIKPLALKREQLNQQIHLHIWPHESWHWEYCMHINIP